MRSAAPVEAMSPSDSDGPAEPEFRAFALGAALCLRKHIRTGIYAGGSLASILNDESHRLSHRALTLRKKPVAFLTKRIPWSVASVKH